MGYAATNIVVYGVKIGEADAEKIFKSEIEPVSDWVISQPENTNIYRKVAVNCLNKYVQQEPVTPYEAHRVGLSDRVFYIDLYSDATDSRIQTNKFDEGFDHYFGIYVASNGYARSDNIEYFIRNTPPEAIELFNKLAKPILEKHNVKIDKVDTYVINQVL